ncbi:MAG: hypothetical protein Q7J54_06255 [Candidatus Woesearchaeota archaeon]|nr:hypothetical protein [Candidatus Woesearchaeota archaeon]
MHYQTLMSENLEVEKGDLVYRRGRIFNSYYRIEQIILEGDTTRLALMHLPKHMMLCLLGEDKMAIAEPFNLNEIKELATLDGIIIPTLGKEPMLIKLARRIGYSRGNEFDKKELQQTGG